MRDIYDYDIDMEIDREEFIRNEIVQSIERDLCKNAQTIKEEKGGN